MKLSGIFWLYACTKALPVVSNGRGKLPFLHGTLKKMCTSLCVKPEVFTNVDHPAMSSSYRRLYTGLKACTRACADFGDVKTPSRVLRPLDADTVNGLWLSLQQDSNLL
ncbi:hypothetical protein Tco_0324789 [Tanacetum coccineum]